VLVARPKTPPPPDETPSLKQRLAQRQKAERRRQELVRFTIVAVLFAVLIGYAVGLAVGVRLGMGTTVGVLYTALSFKYPRQALWIFLIYMPFSGSVTYLVGSSPLLQLAKDGFYIPALFGVVQYCRREKLPLIIPPQLVPSVVALLALSLTTLLLVNGGDQLAIATTDAPLLLGLLGLKVLMGYIPLIVCAYYLLRDRRDLLFLMRLTVVVVLACCALAFVQYLLLTIGYCPGTRFEEGEGLLKASLEARCFVGGSVLYTPELDMIRLPGTFVAPWQWGWFLISGAFLTFPTAFSDPQVKWRTLGITGLAAVFIMAVLSGQRIALILVPIIFVILLLRTEQRYNIQRIIPGAVLLGLGLGYVAIRNLTLVQDRLASLQSRWNASPPYRFIWEQFDWVMQSGVGLLGHGLGRATNSGRTLAETELIEAYYPKLLYEIGPLGLLAFLAVATTLTVLTWRAYRSVGDRPLRSYGAALWLFILFISYNTYFYPLDVDPVAVYYWFFAGVILKLPVLEQGERVTSPPTPPATTPLRRRFRLKRSDFA
jgi:hypothetical protein